MRVPLWGAVLALLALQSAAILFDLSPASPNLCIGDEFYEGHVITVKYNVPDDADAWDTSLTVRLALLSFVLQVLFSLPFGSMALILSIPVGFELLFAARRTSRIAWPSCSSTPRLLPCSPCTASWPYAWQQGPPRCSQRG